MKRLKILLASFAGLLPVAIALSIVHTHTAGAQENPPAAAEPVHYRLTCVGNGGCVANFPALPPDKRLSIQHVSTRVRGTYSSIAWADAAVGARADNHGCGFAFLYWVPLQATGYPSGYFVANQPMNVFIDPDPKCPSQILADGNGYLEADFAITGYLSSK